MDLDGFKEVNDTHGHQAGDLVLHEVARRLSALVREGDVLARIGGDEFGIVVRDGSRATSASLAQRITASVSQPVCVAEGQWVSVGVSVGIAEYGSDVTLPSQLLARADQALYRAKQRASSRGLPA
jgi:diguanylate cyclase (GGDEF)-like protein